jgi:hypothetical protein
MSELLDEELPIPSSAVVEEPEREREWLDDLLDEDFPIPEPAAPEPSGLAPAEPEPEPAAAASREPQAQPVDDDDFLPPPPPRLLRNLFEPDPDDPLVQAMQAAEAEHDDEG